MAGVVAGFVMMLLVMVAAPARFVVMLLVMMTAGASLVVMLLMMVAAPAFPMPVLPMMVAAPTFLMFVLLMMVAAPAFPMFVLPMMVAAPAFLMFVLPMMVAAPAFLVLMLPMMVRAFLSGDNLHVRLHSAGKLRKLRQQRVRLLGRQAQLPGREHDHGFLNPGMGVEFLLNPGGAIGAAEILQDVHLGFHRLPPLSFKHMSTCSFVEIIIPHPDAIVKTENEKMVFVGLTESNTFPRGEGAPKGRMRNGET